MGGYVWCAPSGDFLVTLCGYIFTSTDNSSTDMRYVAKMTESSVTALGFAQGKNYIVALENGYLKLYDYINYSYVAKGPAGLTYLDMFVKGNDVYLIRRNGVNTEFVPVGLK